MPERPAYAPPLSTRIARVPWLVPGLVAGTGIVFGGLVWLGYTATPRESNTRDDAQWSCRFAIKARLHDPDSAQWVRHVVSSTPGGYTVTWTIRAKNAFGALRLGSYACDVGPSGKTVLAVNALP